MNNTTVLTPPPAEVKTPEPPKPPEAIKEENQKTVAGFVDRMFDGQKKSKPAPVDKKDASDVIEPKLDADGKPIEDSPAPAKVAAKKKSAVAAKPAPKPEPSAAPDYEKIAEAAARGVASAIQPKATEKKEEPKQKYEFLSEDEREEIPVLEQMEKSNPTKYKGLTEKFTSAVKARQEYEAKWESENPGKEFDPDAEEHNEFFSKNEVDWKDRDYAEAIADIKVSKMQSQMEKKTDAKIGELTARDKARELEPTAISESKQTGRALFTALGDEFKDVLSEAGTINQDAIKKAYEADPVKAKLVFDSANALETLAAENVRLFNGVVAYDANNVNHAYLSNYASNQEKAMEQLSLKEKKNENGQMFSPAADYYKMNKADRAKHWTFSAKDLNMLLSADQIRTVKATIVADEKMLDERAAKRGYKKEVKAESELDENPPAERGVERVEKPLSPSSVEAQILSSNRGGNKTPPKAGLNGFLTRFTGR
jgi:hypothetical protein